MIEQQPSPNVEALESNRREWVEPEIEVMDLGTANLSAGGSL